MVITDTHRRVLERIGVKGGGREKLLELADTSELRELIAFGLVRYAPVGDIDIWYLTRAGAEEIDADPELVPEP